MKKIKRIMTVLVASAALLMSTPSMAQNDPNNTTTNSSNDNDNDNWGWVGLLGLLGLVGLKRKDDKRTSNYSTANTGANR
jgi:hypothetical protein